MAKIESNQMRRAHRVNIPLIVIVDNQIYQANDWSMTGVGLSGYIKELQKDEIVDASIVLAMKEAKVEFPVKLQLKAKRGDVSGFEFVNISEPNRRVLREFLELAIEGKLESVDGLLSIYNEPLIDTPIKESIVFSDEEESELKKAFEKRSKVYIVLGVIVFITILLTILYNTSYVYRSIGTVSGNFIKVTPSVSGKIAKIYHHSGDIVPRGELLFELDEQVILNKLEILDKKLADLKGEKVIEQSSKLVSLYYTQMKLKQKAYQSARNLFSKKLITRSELQKAYNAYLQAKIAYIDESNKGKITNTKDPKVLALITQLKLQKEEFLDKLNYLRTFSTVAGKVYGVKYHEGHYVVPTNTVMILETFDNPYVVCKLTQQEAVHIQRGMQAEIYDSSTDTTYKGTVASIGNLSLNTESEITNEVSLKEVTVKIAFNDKHVQLPLNKRVKVWFYRSLW